MSEETEALRPRAFVRGLTKEEFDAERARMLREIEVPEATRSRASATRNAGSEAFVRECPASALGGHSARP